MFCKEARSGSRSWRAGLATLVPVGALLSIFIMSAPASAASGVMSRPASTAGGIVSGEAVSGGPFYGYGGLCVDDRSGYVAEYNPVQMYPCNSTASQQWTFDPSGDTLHFSANNSRCLDIYAGGTWNGDSVDLYPCNNSGAQVWIPRTGGAWFNPQSGKCLDDPNWSTAPSTQLDIWDCNGGANQNWELSLPGLP